jgi:hypothetical protein
MWGVSGGTPGGVCRGGGGKAGRPPQAASAAHCDHGIHDPEAGEVPLSRSRGLWKGWLHLPHSNPVARPSTTRKVRLHLLYGTGSAPKRHDFMAVVLVWNLFVSQHAKRLGWGQPILWQSPASAFSCAQASKSLVVADARAFYTTYRVISDAGLRAMQLDRDGALVQAGLPAGQLREAAKRAAQAADCVLTTHEHATHPAFPLEVAAFCTAQRGALLSSLVVLHLIWFVWGGGYLARSALPAVGFWWWWWGGGAYYSTSLQRLVARLRPIRG